MDFSSSLSGSRDGESDADAPRGGAAGGPSIHVLLHARLITTTNEYKVVLHELSHRIASVEGEVLPPVGTCLFLRRGPLDIFAEVCWSDGHRADLHFEEPLTDAELHAHLKAPEPPPAPAEPRCYRPGFHVCHLTAEEQAIADAWMKRIEEGWAV